LSHVVGVRCRLLGARCSATWAGGWFAIGHPPEKLKTKSIAVSFTRINIYNMEGKIYMSIEAIAPTMELDTQIVIRISRDMLKKLDDIRRRDEDLPGRPEMIRRLIEREDESGGMLQKWASKQKK
jgi:hypothetical protein